MSRSRAGVLPALRAVNDPEDAWVSPRVDGRAYQRIDTIEDRLVQQERTTHNLIEKAYRIKEDIIDNLNITHGSWQEEKKARELLQDHIRTITDVVRKLSKDISYLEEQIRVKGGMTEGANTAVKNLELHHVAGITDVRGRIARCDASIAKLSGDLKTCYDSIRTLNQTQLDSNGKLMDRIHSTDAKYNTVLGRLEKLSTEQELQIRSVGSDSSHQVSALDSKTRTMIEETRSTLKSYKLIEEGEREKLEARLTALIEQSLVHQDTTIERLDRKMEEQVATLNRRVLKLEEELKRERERNISSNQALEQKVTSVMDTQLKRQNADLAKLKRECHEGFSTVHESISNMKQVLDGKRKLMEDQLHKEISQIRKMVVLI